MRKFRLASLRSSAIFFIFFVLALVFTQRIGQAQSVAQGYGADSQLQIGLIVKLKDNSATNVEPVGSTVAAKTLGVVVDPNTVPATLSSNTSGPQVYVAANGTVPTLVSNQAGVIKSGDYITISSLNGVGMKAGSQDEFVLGKAAAGFDGKTGVINNSTLTDSKGNHINVAISRILVNMAIGRNPLTQSSQVNLPGFLREAGQSIGGKPVSTARLYISLVVLAASVITTAIILYAGIRSGITAIGRNPLSKKTISRSLLQVVLAGLIIFIIGLFAVYLLLKL